MEAVKITIISKVGIDEKCEPLEQISYGQIALRAGKYYVIFDESKLSGMEGTKTTLKWDEDSLTVIRHGTFQHRQEYRVGCVCESIYKTPYMEIPIQATTREIAIDGQNSTWQLHVEYDLVVGGEDNGIVILDILIEEDSSREYQDSAGQLH